METIHVRCADGVCVPFRTADGIYVHGRYFGRDAAGAVMPEGEVVPVGPGNRNDLYRAIHNDRHLAIVPASPAGQE